MEIQQLDADKFANWDTTNILEGYLGYRYNDILAMYYKYDDQSNEDIHGLNSKKDYENMIIRIINGHEKRLHVFVDHEEEELVEPVSTEVLSPMLLLSQTHSEVEIQYSEDDMPNHSIEQPTVQQAEQPVVHPTQQPVVQPAQQPALKSTREPRRQSVQQPAQQPTLKFVRKSTWEPQKQSIRQLAQQPAQQQPQDEDDDEDLKLSDFEVIDEEEEDIFTESEENVLRKAREETSKWYQSWDKASTSNEGCDAINDPDDMSPNSETFDNMSSEGDDEGEHHLRRAIRYPEWMPKRDLKEIVQ